MKTNRLKITFDLSCSDEVLTQLQAIIKDKGFEKPFDLVSLFPAYLRTSQVFIKEQLTDLDFTDGHLLALKIEGVKPIEKSAPIGNPAQPTEFNFLMIGSDKFQNRRAYSRENIIKEFPNTPENFILFDDFRYKRFTGSIDAFIFENQALILDFCRANQMDKGEFLAESVVYITDPIGLGNVYLCNPQTYHKNITSKYEK